MIVREYRSADLPRIIEIFEDTVNTVCRADYTPEQISAWLGGVDYSDWDKRYGGSFTLVAESEGVAVAFGNMLKGAAVCGRTCGGKALGRGDGYLDMLYTAKEFLRCGAASLICGRLEAEVDGDIYADASQTALPFFLKRGYSVVRRQCVYRCGVALHNYAAILHRFGR